MLFGLHNWNPIPSADSRSRGGCHTFSGKIASNGKAQKAKQHNQREHEESSCGEIAVTLATVEGK